jgi:hypothetical protein
VPSCREGLTIVERIAELHTEIEEVVDKYVDESQGGPGRAQWRPPANGRWSAGGCRCDELRIIEKTK